MTTQSCITFEGEKEIEIKFAVWCVCVNVRACVLGG